MAGIGLLATACSGKNNVSPVVPPPVIRPDTPATVAACSKCIVVAEQSQNRIVIADVASGALIWEWKPEASNVKPEHVKWFSNPSASITSTSFGQITGTTGSGSGVNGTGGGRALQLSGTLRF